jgi:hypothetical protein
MLAVARDRDARRGLRVIMFGLSQITSGQGMEPHREQEAPVLCLHDIPAARTTPSPASPSNARRFQKRLAPACGRLGSASRPDRTNCNPAEKSTSGRKFFFAQKGPPGPMDLTGDALRVVTALQVLARCTMSSFKYFG